MKTLFSTILCFHCELGSLNFDVGLIFPVATTTSLPDAVPYCVDVCRRMSAAPPWNRVSV